MVQTSPLWRWLVVPTSLSKKQLAPCARDKAGATRRGVALAPALARFAPDQLAGETGGPESTPQGTGGDRRQQRQARTAEP